MPRKFLIDTDTASDDAVALLMAFRHPDIEVELVTVVAGNVPVDQGVQNALYVAELCQVDVPVYRGATAPLARPYQHAEWFHGADGMGDQNYPLPKREPEQGDAITAMIETIQQNPGITVVTLGPLTNLALALQRAPEIVHEVGRCVVMGGAINHGNVTPAAEYNVWVDPEAAQIVFRSGMPIEMVAWEFCQGEFVLSPTEIQNIRSIPTPFAQFTLDCNEVAIKAFYTQTKQHGLSLPDPVAMAVAIDPTICTKKSHQYIDIETESDLTRGMTVIDVLGVSADARNRSTWVDVIAKPASVEICWQLDADRWKNLLQGSLIE